MHEPTTRSRGWSWFPATGELARLEEPPPGAVALTDEQALSVLLRSVVALPLLLGRSPMVMAMTASLVADLWGDGGWS